MKQKPAARQSRVMRFSSECCDDQWSLVLAEEMISFVLPTDALGLDGPVDTTLM